MENEKGKLTRAEKYIGGTIAYSFERHWLNISQSPKDSYDPAYCQQLVNFAIGTLEEQFNSKEKIPPPHLSEFARAVGTSVSRMNEWAELFAEFKEAMRIFQDVHCEMLLNGSLIGKYSPDMAKLLLAKYHDIKEDKDPAPQLAMIPISVGLALNHILKQHNMKPIELPIEEAEFTDVKPESKHVLKADPKIAAEFLKKAKGEGGG